MKKQLSDSKRILVIAAHPDDEVLGCGGMIARETDSGNTVKVIIIATGKSSRHDPAQDRNQAEIQQEIDQLYRETRSAMGILGLALEDVTFGNFPDQELDTIPMLELCRFLKAVIQEFKPDIVYTHHSGDYNPDHRVVFDAVLTATRPCHGEFYPKEVYTFEVLSSTEWAFQKNTTFCPNTYLNIADQITRKRQAILAYKSELREYPHPRSERGVENLAMKRGNEVSMEYAEAFCLIRRILY